MRKKRIPMTNRRAIFLFLSLCLMCARPAAAGELFGFFGGMKDTSTKDGSYAWSMEYRESLGEHFAASLVYLNEGHPPNHHRDGHGAMLWARTNLLDRRLSLAVGAGPYYYFDTTEPPTGGVSQRARFRRHCRPVGHLVYQGQPLAGAAPLEFGHHQAQHRYRHAHDRHRVPA